MNRRPIFQAVKALREGRSFTLAEVKLLDAAIDEALAVHSQPVAGRRISAAGLKLMQAFEGCKLEAYPDPGSVDGNPWTIGWGSTGPDIYKGVVWTQEQADERFANDLAEKYGKALDKLLGDSPTTQNQYDAMLSLIYNIGIGGFSRSTVLREHKKGNYKNAAQAFLMWNKNDGKVMKGLTRRRLAEADLYDD